MEPDITQSLKDTENSLRDFIAAMLEKSLGDDWTSKCGVTPDRVEKWKQRKAVEAQRQEGGVVEERLIYYADFYDIPVILRKHWDKFAPALGDLKTMEVYLGEMETLRDPDAHRRELLPHQKYLAAGIAGEIRTRIIRYRSSQETAEGFFPRFESVRDNLGNLWTPGKDSPLDTEMVLRPGDVVEYVATASDPMGGQLEYMFQRIRYPNEGPWQKRNSFSITIDEKDIARSFFVEVFVRSDRTHHAGPGYDDTVIFRYTVLPRRK